jgi:predicted Fe-S protein YdhL (DUF1289 family)
LTDAPAVPRIISPCVKVCVIDGQSGLCAGCGRSLAEIGRWLSYSDEERRAIMAALPARLAGAGPQTPGGRP